MNEELMKKVKKEFGDGDQAILEKKVLCAILLQYHVIPDSKSQVGLYQSNNIFWVIGTQPGKNPKVGFADSKHDGIMLFAECISKISNDK